MTYKQAWENLENVLRARAEEAFFAKTNPETYYYGFVQISLDHTLEAMKSLEKNIPKLEIVK